MSRIITLRFIPLLHCFYLCPLCGLAERWAIFWRSTQLNKMISNQQTARGATLKTRTARESVCLRAAAVRVCVCEAARTDYFFLYLCLSWDSRFCHILSWGLKDHFKII